MNHGTHVLVVSRDQMLLQTRALILGAYFQVESAGRVAEAEAAMAKISFDLVVLCYSLSDGEYQRLVELCQSQTPRPRILALHTAGNGRPRPGSDSEYAVEQGPYDLLKKTAEVLGHPLKAIGRAGRS
jgi:DNA-binding NtrC family response regulator